MIAITREGSHVSMSFRGDDDDDDGGRAHSMTDGVMKRISVSSWAAVGRVDGVGKGEENGWPCPAREGRRPRWSSP